MGRLVACSKIILLRCALLGVCGNSWAQAAERAPFARFSTIAAWTLTTAEVTGARLLNDEVIPDPRTYTESPLAGTFSGKGLLNLRTVESTFVELGEGRELVLGAGLDSLASGDSTGTLEKKKGGRFDLHLWSLLLETGVRKHLGSGQAAEVLVSGMWGLGGKAHYVFQGRDAAGSVRETSCDDAVSRAWRVVLTGRYTIPLLAFLEAGVQVEGDYGSIAFTPASRKLGLAGVAGGLVLQMSID